MVKKTKTEEKIQIKMESQMYGMTKKDAKQQKTRMEMETQINL